MILCRSLLGDPSGRGPFVKGWFAVALPGLQQRFNRIKGAEISPCWPVDCDNTYWL